MPPLAEQQEIVRRVDELFRLADKVEARYAKAKQYIDGLKQSILAKAFRGDLVPQDPNDEPASVLLERIREARSTPQLRPSVRRTKKSRSPMANQAHGRDSAGRPSIIQLHTQAVKTDLPKLLWTKRRIESLLQGGRVKEAIALAEKANLVCRGAAFIAWDDAEQVAIAQDEVYQPSLDVPSRVACTVGSTPDVALMPAPSAAFMPGGSRVLAYEKRVLPCETVSLQEENDRMVEFRSSRPLRYSSGGV